MAKTYQDAIDKVMVKLRESKVDSLSDDYVQLIGAWINTIKEELEDSWDWYAGRKTITFDSVANQREYTLPGANERSRLIYEKHPTAGRMPMLFDVTDANQGVRLREMDNSMRQSMSLRFSTQTAAKPMHFSLQPTHEDLRLLFRDLPEQSRTYTGVFYVPDGELTSLDDVIRVPFAPLVLGTLWIAASERGEELGLNTDLLYQAYQHRAAQAKVLEMNELDTLMVAE